MSLLTWVSPLLFLSQILIQIPWHKKPWLRESFVHSYAAPDTIISGSAAGFFAAQADGSKDALKSSIYTGIAYLITVALLIAPFLFCGEHSYLLALGICLVTALAIIAAYNAYISVVRGQPFMKRFFQMAVVSLGVAGISFVVGIIVKNALGIDI